MSSKVQPETNTNKRRRKRKKRKRKKIKKKPSLFTRLHEQYKKRKWLVRTVFITKCSVSAFLLIIEVL